MVRKLTPFRRAWRDILRGHDFPSIEARRHPCDIAHAIPRGPVNHWQEEVSKFASSIAEVRGAFENHLSPTAEDAKIVNKRNNTDTYSGRCRAP